MSEVWAGMQAVIGMIIVTITAMFMMWGGRSIAELQRWNLAIFGDKSNRVWGRLIAPIFFSASLIALSFTSKFSWWYVASLPAYLAAAKMGYGGKSLWQKIVRRAVWSLTWSAAALTFAFGSSNPGVWIIFATQVAVGLLVAVLWGISNPTLAPREEYAIKFMNLVLVPVMVL